MKASLIAKGFRSVIALAGLGLALNSRAASLSVTITPAHTTIADAANPGTASTVTTVTDAQTGATLAVSGRNYGVVAGGNQWGIQAGNLPWNSSQTGFIVTNGFGPSAPGSKTTATGGAASYLTVAVGNVQPNTLFQNVSIEFTGLAFTRTTNAWAAASPNSFGNWAQAVQSGSGTARKLQVNIPDFTWNGENPLEFRLYGMTALDEGGFSSVKVSANLLPAAPVPEPGVVIILGLWLLVTYTGRYRPSRR